MLSKLYTEVWKSKYLVTKLISYQIMLLCSHHLSYKALSNSSLIFYVAY